MKHRADLDKTIYDRAVKDREDAEKHRSALAQEIVTAFVGACFEVHEERHVRRHRKVLAIERAGIAAPRE